MLPDNQYYVLPNEIVEENNRIGVVNKKAGPEYRWAVDDAQKALLRQAKKENRGVIVTWTPQLDFELHEIVEAP